MANARFHVWGKRARSRRSALLVSIPLLCLLIIGSMVAYHLLPSGNTTPAHASGTVQIPGHVPGLEKTSTLLGQTDPHMSIQLLIGLKPRDAQGLQSYVDSMGQPQSSNAHRYLTPAQVATAFAPALSAQDSLIAYMQQQGFTLTSTYKQHLVIGFKGTIGNAEQAFGIQINNYRAPGGRTFYAPSSNPSVPSSLAPIVQAIIGLDNTQVYTHPPIPSKSNVTAAAQPHIVSCLPAQTSSFTYYLPSQIASAYNLSGLYTAGYQGQGQSVALFELDDFISSDISTYANCYGGAKVPITRILVNGGTSLPPGSGASEVELDMELVLSAAPKLAGLKVYEAANTNAGYIANWTQIINDGVPVVSTSWGSCELSSFAQSVYTEENTLFQVAVLQGQSIFAASGDTGTNDCRNNPATTQAVDDPASQPDVTGVGGTKLTLGANNTYGSESVWNDQYGAGGGGVSKLWTMPSYQATILIRTLPTVQGRPATQYRVFAAKCRMSRSMPIRLWAIPSSAPLRSPAARALPGSTSAVRRRARRCGLP